MNPTPSLDPKGEAGAKKTPLQLLPPYALAQTALAHAEGARRYGPWNWRTNKVCATTYIGAILRHLTAWQDGEDIDADSGLSHIAKIGACCNILLDARHCGTLVDDRSKVPQYPVPLGLPPLPPVPEGFSRWEYRGMGWKADLATYSCLPLGGTKWSTWGTTPASGYQDTHYIEAVK